MKLVAACGVTIAQLPMLDAHLTSSIDSLPTEGRRMAGEETYPDQWEYTIALCKARRTPFGVAGYQTWRVDLVNDEPVKGAESMPRFANRLGADGWELTSTTFVHGNAILLFFRRFLPGQV